MTARRTIGFPSYWRVWFFKVRLWLGLRFCSQPAPPHPQYEPPSVWNIGFGQIFKFDSTANEVHALDWIRANTTVPVPKVYGAWYHPEYRDAPDLDSPDVYCCVIMSRIPGVTLNTAWSSMSKDDCRNILSELKNHVNTLKYVPQPKHMEGIICSFIGGAMRDAGLTIWNAVEPFPSIKEFVDFFLDDIDENVLPEKTQWKEILYERTEYLTLSHGDLHPHNIMVKKSAKTGRLTVTGIVDWTTAGWFPIYWEAFKARKTLAAPKNWNQFARFFTGYPKEAIEILEEMHSGSPR